jgi:hypothetical protein
VASPFGCRSGHISAFAEATLPRDGQVGEGVSPALDAQTEKHNDPRRSTYSLQQRSQTVEVCGLSFTVLIQASVRQGDSAPPPSG